MKSSRSKRIALVLGITASASVVGYAGFWLGSTRAEYIENRGAIKVRLSANAKLDAGLLDALRRDNDFLIRASFSYLQTLPVWLRALHPDKHPDSDTSIKKQAQSLKLSLDRTSELPISEAEAEHFVRRYMGTHSEIQMPQSFIDEINESLKNNRLHE